MNGIMNQRQTISLVLVLAGLIPNSLFRLFTADRMRRLQPRYRSVVGGEHMSS